MSDVTELRDYGGTLQSQLAAVLEELKVFVAHRGDPKLRPFVEDKIADFDETWAAFKDALGTV